MSNFFKLLAASLLIAFATYFAYNWNSHNDRKIKHQKQVDVIKLPLRNVANKFHYVDITVGTPPQSFSVYIDISTNDFWIPSTQCEQGSCNTIMPAVQDLFNPSASTTYRNHGILVDIKYATGHLSEETVCISSLCVNSQFFIEATWTSIWHKMYQNNGSLGLGRLYENETNVLPFLYSLIYGKQIRPIYSLWLNGTTDSIKNDGGELMLGGINTERFVDPITWVPALNRPFWSFEMSQMKVNGSPAGCFNGCIVQLHNIETGFFGPPREIEFLHEELGEFSKNVINGHSMYFILNCTQEMVSSLPNITLKIGNTDFTLTSSEYIYMVEFDNGKCHSRLQSMEQNHEVWVFGSQFMIKYFTVTDIEQQRIGFATAV